MGRAEPNGRRRLIVNADDFGKSDAANQAIIRAFREGILTSASLMVNEPGFSAAVALARAHPRLGVGLHLTLVDGHATLPAEQISGLVDGTGRFASDPARAGWRYFFSGALRAQLRLEMEAQVGKFRATGLRLGHLDGHHHLQMHPVIMGHVLARAGAWGLTHLRLTREPFRVHWRAGARFSLPRCGHALAHRLLARRARAGLRRLGIRHPQAVFGLLNAAGVDEDYLAGLLPALPAGDSEVFAHPALGESEHELRALTSPEIRGLVKLLDIQLIRYQDM